MQGWQKILIILVLVAILTICAIAIPISTSNRAVTMEEQIGELWSNVGAQEQRRFDLYSTLAEAVNAARNADELQVQIAEARTAAEGGDTTEANVIIQAVVEAYPQLGSHQAYLAFMTEAPLTENMIVRYRESYNNAVREYRAFVRRFPNSLFLDWRGHNVIDFQFLDFQQAGQGPPADLFR